jgi:hypothetical protein
VEGSCEHGNELYISSKRLSCMKSSVFWDITPCSPLKISRCFGGSYRLHPPKRQLTFNGLHGVISQKIERFITTSVRSSNPTEVPLKIYNKKIDIKELTVVSLADFDCKLKAKGFSKHSTPPQTVLCTFWLIPHPHSAVGIATGYGLDDQGVGIRVPVR